MTTATSGPLSDLKVVEFAQNAAMPQCARLLASFGADVVKIEPPTGDAMRHLAPLGENEGRAYHVANPGKRAICLNLSSPDARDVVDRLVDWADIVLVGMKQTDLARYGLDWERLHERDPSQILAVITAFGPNGPDADQGGYEVLAQARSGMGFIMNRSHEGVPTATRPAITDIGTGNVMFAAVLAAVRHRDKTGEGQRVDTSLLGTAMNMGTMMLGRFEQDGTGYEELGEEIALMRTAGADFDTQRAVYESRVLAAGGAFRLYFRHYLTSDGIVSVAALSPALIGKFHDFTGVAAPGTRQADHPDFVAAIDVAEAFFAERTTEELMTAMRAAGLPCTPYNMPFEALEDEQVRANNYVVDLEHPTTGSYTTAGLPMHFSAMDVGVTGPSPTLGQHTAEVLLELGYDQAGVDELANTNVVRLAGSDAQ